MINHFSNRLREMIKIGTTSVLLTMSIFRESPSPRVRPPYAIERTLGGQLTEQFDPREVIEESVVLTLPLDATHTVRRRQSFLSQN